LQTHGARWMPATSHSWRTWDTARTGRKQGALAKVWTLLLMCSPAVGECAVQTMRSKAETMPVVCASHLQAYKIDFPAPGDPALAARVNTLLRYAQSLALHRKVVIRVSSIM